MPAGWALLGLNYVDRIFLVNYFDLKTIGVYGLAYSVGTLIVPLILKPFRTMFPNSAAELYNQNDLKTLQRLYDRSAGLSLLLSLPAATGLLVLGEPLLRVFATPEFSDGGLAIAVISAAYICLIFSDYFMVSLGLVHRQHLTTIAYYAALVLHILLNFILIPRFSIMGAAISTLFAFFALLGFCFVFAAKYKVFNTDFGFIAKILVSATVMGFLSFLFDISVARPLGNSIIELIIVPLFGIAVYLGLLRIFGVITLERVRSSINALRTKRYQA
jgi:O-antigen/teichoic acid export membrane protein